MGVKSTVDLTREEAEELYHRLAVKLYGGTRLPYSNKELEAYLEEMNDEYYGGEGFDNYLIVDKEK